MAHTVFRRSALLTTFDLAIRFNYTRIKNLQCTLIRAMITVIKSARCFYACTGRETMATSLSGLILFLQRACEGDKEKQWAKNSWQQAAGSCFKATVVSTREIQHLSNFTLTNCPLPTAYCPLFKERRSISLPLRSNDMIDLGGALRLNSSVAIFTFLFARLSLSLRSVTITRPSLALTAQ